MCVPAGCLSKIIPTNKNTRLRSAYTLNLLCYFQNILENLYSHWRYPKISGFFIPTTTGYSAFKIAFVFFFGGRSGTGE
jgi:hypothetical protein